MDTERKTQATFTSVGRPAAVLALISLPVFIGALDLTIVSAVLPNVIVDLRIPFQTGGDEAAWIVSGYLLAYTISVAVMGRISDIIGRRRTYFLALLIFVLGSWWVAVATTAPAAWTRTIIRIVTGTRADRAYSALYALIAGRVIQALGAGAMVPVSMALVGDLYPPAKRAPALGVIGAVDTAGWVLGHLYGGLMVQIVDWPVLFWINIPITTVVAIITWRQLVPIASQHNEGGISGPGWAMVAAGGAVVNLLAMIAILRGALPSGLPSALTSLLALRWLALAVVLILLAAAVLILLASRRTSPDTRADWPGVILLTLALAGLNIGLGGQTEAAPDASLEAVAPLPPYALPVLLFSALAIAVFVWWQRRTEHPLFAPKHFRKRNVSLSAIVNLFVGFCLMVGLVSVPLFINAVVATSLDQAALVSGVLLGALTIPMALASVPGGILTERFGYRVPTVIGMALAAVGFYLGRTWTPDIPRVTMGLHMALAGIGLGLTVAPVSTAVINAVQTGERGIASALVLVMRLVGMTIGTSLMTGYGLRRVTALTTRMVQTLGESPALEALAEITINATTTVINEMLLIAAGVCVLALLPALFLRKRDV